MKVYNAVLRKTCISKLPVDAIKEHGSDYVVTVSSAPGELLMMSFERWEEEIKIYDVDDLKSRSHLRRMFSYAVEYSVEQNGSTLCTEATKLIGDTGDKLLVFWSEEDGLFKIINKTIVNP